MKESWITWKKLHVDNNELFLLFMLIEQREREQKHRVGFLLITRLGIALLETKRKRWLYYKLLFFGHRCGRIGSQEERQQMPSIWLISECMLSSHCRIVKILQYNKEILIWLSFFNPREWKVRENNKLI